MKFKTTEIDDDNCQHLLGYEPYFEGYRWIATAHHNHKVVHPCHGYFAPHPHSSKSKKWAKSLGYTFNND
jgi:hypothetical protein